MIRVGFIQEFSNDGWLGGSSYYRNLFLAIMKSPARSIEPVLITSKSNFAPLRSQFPDVAIVELPLLDAPSLVTKARRVMRVLSGRDVLMERALLANDIRIVSHSSYFGRRSPVASIVWIPDFQELAFPEFFSAGELASRRGNASRSSRHASTIVLSSEAALRDLSGTGNSHVDKAVLQFVANVPPPRESLPLAQLRNTYGLMEKYFHLPNQFWVHKNHQLVIQALALLRRQGRIYQVVATGSTADHRQPDHFNSLMATARELGVDDLFRPVGVVPYQELMSLMHHAVAVINPSKFEGWSTTVEEAKSMGKAIILSDIPVHREQAPERAAFFPPDDPVQLAARMSEAWESWDAAGDAQFVEKAAANLAARRNLFAHRYEEIVLATLARHNASTRDASAAVIAGR